MSLFNIRRLLQEDNLLKLPHLIEYSKRVGKVVTVICVESTLSASDQYPGLIQMSMLHINTKGKIAWTVDWVNPEKGVAPLFLQKLGVTREFLDSAQGWRKGWSQAIKHIAANHIVVSFQSQDGDLYALQRQYARFGGGPVEWAKAFSVKDLFHNRHQNRSSTLNDMASYYQVYMDSERDLKSKTVAIAKLFERLITEIGMDTIVQDVTPVSVALEASSIPAHVATTVDPTIISAVKLQLLKLADSSVDAYSFFQAVSKLYSLTVVGNGKKILGFSIDIDGQTFKGSQIDSTLAWSQLNASKNWSIPPEQYQVILALNVQF